VKVAHATTRLGPRQIRRIEWAIAEAERGHRGEIRVHVEGRYTGDGPIARAAAVYHALGMDRTRDDTAALLYIALDDRKVAVWHGAGLAGAADERFWSGVTEAVAAGLRAGRPAEGIAQAVAEMGRVMLKAAPGEDVRGNELPNTVSRGPK
jgi:uncharacterized membrane protein